LYERLRSELSLFSDLKLFAQFIEYNDALQSVILTKYQDDHNNGNEMNESFATCSRQDYSTKNFIEKSRGKER